MARVREHPAHAIRRGDRGGLRTGTGLVLHRVGDPNGVVDTQPPRLRLAQR